MNGTLTRTAPLFAATITSGLAAGVFAFYAHTLMPALRATDDRTFVTSFQSIDRSIINPWFIGGTFLGAAACTAAAAVVQRGQPGERWVLIAALAYAIVIVVTFAVHVPLNDGIKAAGAPDAIDVSAIRARFAETRWALWNLVRVAASLASFVALAWSLLLDGRAGQ